MSVEPIKQDTIISALKKWGRRYAIDSDGDIFLSYRPESVLGGSNVFFQLAGGQKDCLQIQAFFDGKLSPARISEAVYLCNKFHQEYVCPCAYVMIPSDETKPARIACQAFYNLKQGIHITGLVNFFESFEGQLACFENWITKQGFQL